MKLRYPRKSNGMYILKKDDMDDIATMLLAEYAPAALERPQAVNIDAVAEDGLHLTVENRILGFTDAVLGLTAFADIQGIPCLDDMYRPLKVDVRESTVLIHSSIQGDKPRRRFTLAHECSHWILHRSFYSDGNQEYAFRMPYIACRAASIGRRYHAPKTDEEWGEWQADVLAGAILMPFRPFCQLADKMIRKCGRRHLTDRVDYEYIEIVEGIADIFQVSKSAAEVRLKQLGYIQKERYA